MSEYHYTHGYVEIKADRDRLQRELDSALAKLAAAEAQLRDAGEMLNNYRDAARKEGKP